MKYRRDFEERMKKELTYFRIEGGYGGNQDWFRDPMMHLGGCAAVTACDICIYLALRLGMRELYPFDLKELSRTLVKSF